VIDKTILRLRN